jgi:glucitol operon activator protein
MDLGFGLLLLAALLLSVVFSLGQQRTYQNATKRLGMSYLGAKDHFLVSGRGKGYLRGAIVLLVIDSASNTIVAAEGMVGSTAFARFKPRPELLGPIQTAPDRAQGKRFTEAVVYALQQHDVTRKRSMPVAARRA